jgi:enoyl-[acyl-carrier protein] reductase III
MQAMPASMNAADPFSLNGHCAVVTGGTRGIGRAISLQFARAGAKVLAVYVRNVEAAEAFQAEIAEQNLAIQACRADLVTDDGLAKMQAAVAALGSPLTTLVHCAATGVHRRIEEATVRHWDWTFDLNVKAVFAMTQRLLPNFAPHACILVLSSIGAVRAVPDYGVVGASKGALEALMRQLAFELGGRGIRVNALAPGIVLTEAWQVLPEAERRIAAATARTPLNRLVSVKEVALAAQFLCSTAASGISGHTLVADCGFAVTE